MAHLSTSSTKALLTSFPTLAEEGLGIVDVGARGGVHTLLREIAPLANVVGFEPDVDECRRLNDLQNSSGFRSLSYLPFALGAVQAPQTLHLCRSGGASSLLRPRRRFLDRFPDGERFEIVTTRPIETTTIDALRVRLPKYVGMMKLDTQGTELDVLHGARATLAEVVAVEAEVEFATLYESQSLFRDVDRFMAEQGFSLFKLRRMHWVRRSSTLSSSRTAGQIVFGDALYLRDPLESHLAASSADPRQAEALLLLASVYDCHDFALELLADANIARLVKADVIRQYVLARMRRSPIKGLWKRRGDRLGISSWLHGYGKAWARGDVDFYSRL